MKDMILRSASLVFLSLFFATAAPAASAPDAVWSVEGGELRLEQLRGKVVYLDFWASWCAPCRKSFPFMNELQTRYGEQGLVVVAVNLDKDRKLVEQFLAKYPAQFTVAYDPKGETAERFGLKGMPSSYLIDRDGEIRLSHVGFRDEDSRELEAGIRNVLEH
ncbi:TlpA family protein disulfide reductase [Thiohalomonas denitrificans]|uniref:Thiol-disulfide isomerase or thioredoxin n=1 Tax=Thiohalomonas denitrificans TaxID=415747 RepID=A0A1G5PVZ5_9GAMM|nr:TlpA disulfide reductase family protein [Thiohalomonas denitrificans]SCZ53592.1 Thiol-disulfide isomerase or thioredoxin [Thiohalomonas denitrificans]